VSLRGDHVVKDMAKARQEWPGSERAARFAALLAVLRAERDTTRKDLSDAAPGVSYQTLSSIEQGVRWPTDASLTNLARALGLDMGALIETRDNLAVGDEATSEQEVVDWLTQVGHTLDRTVEAEPRDDVGFRSDLRWRSSSSRDVYVTVVKTPDGSYRAVPNSAASNRGAGTVTKGSTDRVPAIHSGLESGVRADPWLGREPVGGAVGAGMTVGAVSNPVGGGLSASDATALRNERIAAVLNALSRLDDDDLSLVEDFVNRLSVRR
jgi:transcriptional regulator with XRE-family HTH domain